jgi:hypothetical protein
MMEEQIILNIKVVKTEKGNIAHAQTNVNSLQEGIACCEIIAKISHEILNSMLKLFSKTEVLYEAKKDDR